MTTLSTTVTGLPTTEGTIYARMWSEINGVWQSTDYTYTASGSAVKAVLTSPAPGSTLTGSTVTFGWTAGTAVTAYSLWLGTTGVGSSNLYNSTPPLTTLSTTVTGLPITGGTIYARMWSEINGVWQSTDYTYTASGSAVKAVLTSPAPGSTLTGSTVTFGWTAGTAVTRYSLWLGTTGVGSSNLYNSTPPLTTLSTTVTGLPITGGTIYARMWSEINGVWQSTDYTYTAF